VKRPIQSKLRCDRSVDERQRFGAVFVLPTNRQFETKSVTSISYRRTRSFSKLSCRRRIAIHCPADVNQMRPLRPIATARNGPTNTSPRRAQAQEAPLDLLQMSIQKWNGISA